MKKIIDIPESIIEHLKDGSFGARIKDRAALIDAVMNGTSLPDNATNGDVIKIMFPNECKILTDMFDFFDHTWCNMPYKAGDSNGNG